MLLETNDIQRLTGLAVVEHRLGNVAAARQARDELIAKFRDAVWYQQAQISAQWGDLEAALGALDRAYRIGDAGMVSLKIDPLLDPVRSSPRFSDLLKRMGFA
jgi:predicted Zn-dependent protease